MAELHAAGLEQSHGLPRPQRDQARRRPAHHRRLRAVGGVGAQAELDHRHADRPGRIGDEHPDDDGTVDGDADPDRHHRTVDGDDGPSTATTTTAPPTATTATTKPSPTDHGDDQAVEHSDDDHDQVKAIVLLGGQGTRLRPLTYTTPKQLLPVVEVPMLERVLAHLRAHGVDEAVLSLGYRPDAFFAAYPDHEAAGVRLDYAVEPEPLDTAGAIAFAAGHAGIDETFLVVNGDVLTDVDTSALVAFHRSHGASATIHLKAVDDPTRFGVVPTDADGRVIEFVEKPPADQRAHQPDQRRDLRPRARGAGAHPRRPPCLGRARDLPRPRGRRGRVRHGQRRLLARHGHARRLPAGQRRPARRHQAGPPGTRRPTSGARGVDPRRARRAGRGRAVEPARCRRRRSPTTPP